ncbi:Ribonuclease/ribotoxin [Didymella exigua CBS 183.55]|uniref:Ribonuclease/ribotoxin n=1 Tax=Didymella exigua CBS 183.55 TaxID=1150837 RepID=A0A6A5R3I7_9PLEO|nr:Ribonuclease/ribotoxin [Didymella exigua CBS 183.55]KAF1922212.1 Ribonuclease/ribotoxin [Didymella exigua CBS 183.55]
MLIKALLAIAALASSVAAGVNCAGDNFDRAELDECKNELCKWNNRAGPGGYPHFFANHEGFTWSVSKINSLYIYPLIHGTKAYSGGAPGAHRCIVNYDNKTGQCVTLGAITHTGASSVNGFVQCTTNAT